MKVFNSMLIDRNGKEHKRKYATIDASGKLEIDPNKVKDLKTLKKVEKLALKAIKKEYKAFKKDLPKKTLSKQEKYFIKSKKKADLKLEFYKKYKCYDYEFELNYKTEEVKSQNSEGYLDLYNVLTKSKNEVKEKLNNFDNSIDKNEQVTVEAKVQQFIKDAEDKKALVKTNYKSKLISKKAYKSEKKAIKRETKNNINFERNNKTLSKLTIKHDQLNHEIKHLVKKSNRETNEMILALRDDTPKETYKESKLIRIVSMFIPGVAQLYNKQFKKAFVLFLLGLLVYGYFVPYFFGAFNYQGQGIFGLINLAENGLKVDSSIIYMIEGFLGIILLAFSVIICIGSYSDGKNTRKRMLEGKVESNWYESKKTLMNGGFPALIISPAAIVIAIIILVPVLTTIGLSFTNLDPTHKTKFEWIGFLNYIDLFSGSSIIGQSFFRIVGWTFVWTFAATSFAIFIGFGLALIANNERVKGKPIFRAIYLLPWAIPGFISIMFFSIMATDGGLIERFLENVLHLDNISLKFNTTHTRIFLILMNGWLGSAYVFLLTTGVLQSIPADLYEAASIDGAPRLKKLFKITLPMVLLQVAPLLIGQYTFNFNNFSAIYLFNQGGPFDPEIYGDIAGSTDILISYIYKLTFEQDYQAAGAAITLIISILLIVVAAFGFLRTKAFKKEDNYEGRKKRKTAKN